jgi:D-beta-D-heptose 7-phosphate kinase/D-beta-D-heptose 1-phosphate adenosyltransferase
MKIVVASGGFDPIHYGHIKYLAEAKKLGDKLIVGVNSDEWLTRKKGKPFMEFLDRASIVSSIRYVDLVLAFNDDDGSAIDLLTMVKITHPSDVIIFANGGDRNETNNSEIGVEGVNFVYGVGGSYKQNSSSVILKAWKE